jgi:hypothetical protein
MKPEAVCIHLAHSLGHTYLAIQCPAAAGSPVGTTPQQQTTRASQTAGRWHTLLGSLQTPAAAAATMHNTSTMSGRPAAAVQH